MSGFFGDDEEGAAERLNRAGARRLLFDPTPLGGAPRTFIETDQARRRLFDPQPLGGEPGSFVPRQAKPGGTKPATRKRRGQSDDTPERGTHWGVWGPFGW